MKSYVLWRLGAYGRYIVEPCCKVRLMARRVVGMDDSFACSPVQADDGLSHRRLSLVCVALIQQALRLLFHGPGA